VQDRWFVRRGQAIYGPFSEEQLRQLAAAGRLSPSDMLQAEGSNHWVPATSFQNLFPSSSSQPTADAVVQPLVAARPVTRRSSQEGSPMLAAGAELPPFEFTVRGQRKRILLEVVRSGTLTKVTKTERQYISGSGGGGYVYGNYTPGYGGYVTGGSSPISITTTYETTMELWILGADGRESSFRLKKDIPLKEGHTVTIVGAYLEGTHDTCPFLVVNHSACEAHFLSLPLSLLGDEISDPQANRWISCFGTLALSGGLFVLAWSLLDSIWIPCLLSLLFWLLLSSLVEFLILDKSEDSLLEKAKRKFRQHCYRVGEQLLRGSF